MGRHHQHHSSSKNIAVAFFLNLSFAIVELIGGLFTNSLAIMSDALHDLGDSLSLGLAWYFEKLSKRKPTKIYSYGFKRFSLFGATINMVILIVGSIFIITEAIPRIIAPEEADARGMMWLALLGILVNSTAAFYLKKGKSINERVVSLHLFEDVLGWTAVLIASIVMQFWEVPILDPILSLLIAFYVLYNVIKNMKDSIRIVLQGSPKQISIDAIKERLSSFSEVHGIHDCHLWTLDGDHNVFTSHIMITNPKMTWQEQESLKIEIKKILHDEFHLEHITLELELISEDCSLKEGN